MDTPDGMLARVLDAAADIQEREDQRRPTTRELRTGLAKWFDVDGGIFEHLM